MKKYLLLLLVLMLALTFQTVNATTFLRLDVFVSFNPIDPEILNVNYVAKMDPVQPALIKFYTGSGASNLFPDKYVGSAWMNHSGLAEIKFHQDPGMYAGGAVWESPNGPVYSNVNYYTVQKP